MRDGDAGGRRGSGRDPSPAGRSPARPWSRPATGRVHATPLRWRGETFGALNVFRAEAHGVGPAGTAACRAFADAATVLLVTNGRFDPDRLTSSLDEALGARAVVEQAKGALAHARGLDMAQAFDALSAVADEEGVGLGRGRAPGDGPRPRRAAAVVALR